MPPAMYTSWWCRQPLQHQLPGRSEQRLGRPYRALERPDTPGPQPRSPGPRQKGGRGNRAVTCVTIWGNHSNTQYPDFTNARINGKPATEVITDRGWLETTFVTMIQNRGSRGHQGARLQFRPVGRQRRHRPRQVPAEPDSGQRLGQHGGAQQGRIWRAGRDWSSATLAAPTARATSPSSKALNLDVFGKQKFQLTLKELAGGTRGGQGIAS